METLYGNMFLDFTPQPAKTWRFYVNDFLILACVENGKLSTRPAFQGYLKE